MTTLLTVLLVLSSLIIVGAVLLQPAKGGASLIGGSSNSVFGSSGGTTLLFRATLILGLLVMVICLILSRMRISENKSSEFDDGTLSTSIPMSTQGTQGTAPATNGATPPVSDAKNSDQTPAK